jgi:metal-sulfur cluster biosynthetic enzyme
VNQPDPAPAQTLGDDIRTALYDVVDPELGINVVDLGLLCGIRVDANDTVVIDMTLTSPSCPLSPLIESQVRYVLDRLGHEVVINWVWVPPWGPQRITDAGREQLRALGFNV